MLKCVTCVAIPFVVTVPNKWRKTGHVFAISTGGQEWVSVETVYSQNDGGHNSQAPGLCFSRDVLLEDIRQHIVHNCQEIEQLCGLCPVKLEQGDVLQHKSVCPEKEILCACGQQLLCREEPKCSKADCNHVDVYCPLGYTSTISHLIISVSSPLFWWRNSSCVSVPWQGLQECLWHQISLLVVVAIKLGLLVEQNMLFCPPLQPPSITQWAYWVVLACHLHNT